MATKTDLQAAFSPERIGSLTGTIDSVAIAYTTGRYYHVKVTTADTSSNALALALTTSLSGGAHTVVVTFSGANLTYTLTGSGNFALASMSTLLNGALGYPTSTGAIGGPTSGASVYTSSVRPLYVIRPMLASEALTSGYAAQSNVSGKYYPSGRARVRYAEDGTSSYSISPYAYPKFFDWQHRYERDTPLFNGGAYSSGSVGHAMMSEDVTATMPWAWEHFFDHVRAEEFFAYASQTSPSSQATADIFKMREETSTFSQAARRRGGPDAPYWDVMISALRVATQ